MNGLLGVSGGKVGLFRVSAGEGGAGAAKKDTLQFCFRGREESRAGRQAVRLPINDI